MQPYQHLSCFEGIFRHHIIISYTCYAFLVIMTTVRFVPKTNKMHMSFQILGFWHESVEESLEQHQQSVQQKVIKQKYFNSLYRTM